MVRIHFPPAESHTKLDHRDPRMTATLLSCRRFAANAVRLQLHALAYNLGNFMRRGRASI